MKLVIGNKNYSSWSLRAWLLLAHHNIPFEEVRIALSVPGTAAAIGSYSEAGKVPVLHDDSLIIWDSLAICEYISEQYLKGAGWPKTVAARASARSCCAEMHSGFFALRQQMPMNCRAEKRKVTITDSLESDIMRIDSIWTSQRGRYGKDGPWLFGDFSIADCMFAPVVFRFNTYGPALSETAREYMETMLSHPKVQQWLEEARAEKETIESEEAGL